MTICTAHKAIHAIFIKLLFAPQNLIIIFFMLIALVFSGPSGAFEQLTISKSFVFFACWIFYSILAFYSGLLLANRFFGATDEFFALSGIIVVILMITIGGSYFSWILGSHRYFPEVTVPAILATLVTSTSIISFFYWRNVRTVVVFFKLHNVKFHPIFSRKKTIDSLLFRAPYSKRNRPIRLEAQNQYTNLVMKNSETLIRISITKAVKEMDVTNGMRIHRSHWVAFERISEITKKNRSTFVIMDDGSKVPVSKKNRESLNKALSMYSNSMVSAPNLEIIEYHEVASENCVEH